MALNVVCICRIFGFVRVQLNSLYFPVLAPGYVWLLGSAAPDYEALWDDTILDTETQLELGQ